MDEQQSPNNDWKWRYSPMLGIMYGPIPVGVILVAIGVLIYFVVICR